MSIGLIELEHIFVSVNDSNQHKHQSCDKVLLQDVCISLAQGTVVGIVGPNGAGKSTLLKVAANLLMPQTGQRVLNNKNYDTYSVKAFAAQVAYLQQETHVHWNLTVEHIIRLGFINKNISNKEQLKVLETVMRQTDTHALQHRVVQTLSGGERVRVLIARMLASQASVLLLDEPLAALDPYHQLSVLTILKQYASLGGSVCMVLHDLNHALNYCDYVVLLDQGAVVAQGDPKQVLTTQNLNRVYAVNASVNYLDNHYYVTMSL